MTRRELDPWIEGYLAYLTDVRRMSKNTIIDTRCTLNKVSEFMTVQRPDTPLWKLTLDDYLMWLNAGRDEGRSENVMAKQLSHLRGLLDYTWRSGRCDRNVLDGFSLADRQRNAAPRVLTLQEAQRLVDACAGRSKQQRRARLIVLLLYGCGLRTNELCDLDVPDVDIERQEILVKHGKGGLQRTIPVPVSVWVELLAYLAERGGKRGPLLRTEARGKRIRAKEVGDIVKAAVEQAQIDGPVTPRTLRHTFATHLMDRGVELTVIASLMGHSSPNQTGVYLHVLPGKCQSAVRLLIDDGEEKP